MSKWQGRAGRRNTGGAIKLARSKRAYEAGGESAETKLGQRKIEFKVGRGGNEKVKLLQEEFANVTDPKSNNTKKVKILQFLGNSASIDYQRREIISKGARIRTEIGEALVTSRPGQHGVINATLLKSKGK
ncbi:MAG: 30S ribosomal protein S8e [Promethearchaeati archaeon SRVP18_Atabeyarchaeia-1]